MNFGKNLWAIFLIEQLQTTASENESLLKFMIKLIVIFIIKLMVISKYEIYKMGETTLILGKTKSKNC